MSDYTTTNESLRAAVRQDFDDRTRQLVYADFVEEDGRVEYANYVRFRARLGAESEWSKEQWSRHRELLDAHSECWEWCNLLALEQLDRYRQRVKLHCDPDDDSARRKPYRTMGVVVRQVDVATEQQVRELERLVGRELPIGYRTYLLEIGNGSAVEAGEGNDVRQFQQMFSTERICDRLASCPDALRNARLDCELDWAEAMGIRDEAHPVRPRSARYSKDTRDGSWNRFYIGAMSVRDTARHSVDPDDHEAFDFGRPAGMLQIGEFPYDGEVYLALEGELRGTIWFTTHGGGDSLLSYEYATYVDSLSAEYEPRLNSRSSALPVDTLTGLYGLVIELVPYSY